ncbi:MAG: AarF/ABC1/UbiB kinase family protein [Aphanocapsa sp. GSE-SYN-MK-11-07L]|jgi:predicted unusual protein kinase regulating ubiquinone biosynthesis (AarF/ABC1/UbiB family)|nr:AarF/ABC1/UbiB kinase family protein [Aphanocapsa sp. GSE-SYN-MK-11-07L]
MPVTAVKSLRWQQASSLSARQREIFAAVFSFGWALAWDGLWQRRSPRIRQRRAEWLTETLLHLGPTFIKIGQFLSTRVDLLPLEYVHSLSELQDKVPQFEPKQAIAIIEAELSQPLYALYREFDPQPLAAASLGQVHRARLHTGEDVVVKVQRPGLKSLLDLDYRAIGQLIRTLRRWLPPSRWDELQAVYNEFFAILFREVDYIQEGRNAARFQANFADHPRIVVPQIYWQHTSSKVLTMSYVPGIKVDQRQQMLACGLDPKKINQLGICCYLKQLLQDGFFHADPHPGNLAVTPSGSLIFYDYGMMSEVMAMDKDQMVKTFFAVLKKDTDQVIQTLTSIGLIESVGDMTSLKRITQVILEEFTEKPLDVRAFEQMKQDVYAIFEQQPFRLPAKMTYILKSLTTLDGIARILDPEYNLTAAAQPFVRSLTVSEGKGRMIGELARQARGFITYKLNQPNRTQQTLADLEGRLRQQEALLQTSVRTSDRLLKRLHLAFRCLTLACVSGLAGLAGAMLLAAAWPGLAIAAFVLAGLAAIGLIAGLIQLARSEPANKSRRS